MNKLSSNEVPQKFAEWLLAMGCPPEKVPSVDKIAKICRGQYYMVWRSLMEHAYPKDIIRNKRLQVFCNDVQKCGKKNDFKDCDTVVPGELLLWQQHTSLTQKVADKEHSVTEARRQLNVLTEKISSKLTTRDISRLRVEDLQRRVWLLRKVAEELLTKKENLIQTKSIAELLCTIDSEAPVPLQSMEKKIDKCLNTLARQTALPPAQSVPLLNPAACSSIVSNYSDSSDHRDNDEQLSSLLKHGGEVLWRQICERRARLLSEINDTRPDTCVAMPGVRPQSIIAHTSSLHCTLVLDAIKHKLLADQTKLRLAEAVADLNTYKSGDACELLVLRCERSCIEARVKTLQHLLDELTAQRGVFSFTGLEVNGEGKTDLSVKIAQIDKNILAKKDELKRLTSALAITQRKIQTIRDCLVTVFNGFRKDLTSKEIDRLRGFQVDIPEETMSSLQKFYQERRDTRNNKLQLSLEMDESECSFNGAFDSSNVKYSDELKIYLNKFNLEKNRKLVLENGEKIWIFETIQSSLSRLHTNLEMKEIPFNLFHPSVTLESNLRRLIYESQLCNELDNLAKNLDCDVKKDAVIDITSEIKEEAQTIDKIKKRLNENLLSLQRTSKTLDLGNENLRFWSDNQMKKYISNNRTVDGKTYRDYEILYLENLGI